MQFKVGAVAVCPQSDLFVPALPSGDAQGERCAIRIACLGRHDPGIRLPDRLALFIAEQILRAGIPAQDLALRIEQYQCTILEIVDHKLLELAVR